jgi:DNA repair exonuclease SbcCD ATPase subunit
MTADDQSFSPEALRSLTDEVDIPTERDALNSLVQMLSERGVRQIRKNHKWAQFSGFRADTVNPVVRQRLTATVEKGSQRRKALVFYWLADHRDLLKQIEESVDAESIRDDVLNLLSDGAKPDEIAWALRFSTREEIREAVDERLWDELHDEESTLLAQHSLRRLEKKYEELENQNDELQQENSTLEERVKQLDDELSTAESGLDEQSREIDQLKGEIESLRDEKGDLEAELDNRKQALENAKGELEQKREETRKVKRKLSDVQRKMSKELESIADVLGVPDLPDDHDEVSGVIVNHIEKLQEECRSLESTVENLERELDRLAPALPHIRREWTNTVETFRQEVDAQLESVEETSDSHTPEDDWSDWLSRERSTISDILDNLEQPSDHNLEATKNIQDLLRLRWYLLEWIRLGLIRHLESTNKVAKYLNSSN